MKQQKFKELIRETSEKPIRICLADGVSYKISHPDFAFTTTDSLILASGPAHDLGAEFIICPFSHITRLEVLKPRSKAA